MVILKSEQALCIIQKFETSCKFHIVEWAIPEKNCQGWEHRISRDVEETKYRISGAIALSYPPFFIDESGAEFHAD